MSPSGSRKPVLGGPGIETALFGGVALPLIAAAATWLARRPA